MIARFLGRILPGLALVPALSAPVASAQDWLQWGGPDRNFTSRVSGLASSWPPEGPPEIWSRTLGEGYSGIVVEGNRLYTMYRERAGLLEFGSEDREVVVAIDARDGSTVWEHRYEAPELRRMDLTYGPGPHATPLIVGNRLFTVGAMGQFNALDKETGALLWSRNLYDEFGALWERGYSASPIAWNALVILPTGARGQSVVAFDQSSGEVVWKRHDFPYGPASPILIDVDGQEQLVLFMGQGPVGLDPSNGDLIWQFRHRTDYGLNISTPVWNSSDNLLFLSSGYNGGSRALRITREGNRTEVDEVWSSSRMRIHFGTAVRVGGFVYGSSGDFGPSFLVAINIATGRVAWQERTFARASMIHADGKLIILDEDGTLALAVPDPEGLRILAEANVLRNNAWTAPALAGRRLFVRDRRTIKAIALD
jgi:outer membrane protein assembly factor BamB